MICDMNLVNVLWFVTSGSFLHICFQYGCLCNYNFPRGLYCNFVNLYVRTIKTAVLSFSRQITEKTAVLTFHRRAFFSSASFCKKK